jgi:N-dimethylarginine dimethylaminohydrolase
MKEFNEAIAALKAEYEQKLAEKEAENARLRGKKKNEEERAREQAREYERYLNEYISVKLFRDNDRYKDDVYVAVNGNNCIIKRGEWVRVKRKFALVLDASEIQDMRTAEYLEREQKKFASSN